ncbi:MAG: SDR family NAD(P)-dependent oxidoreductase [Spirochaetaceae bacterium]
MNVDMFSLTGKTALVTGSSRGLGLIFAEGLASGGATVVLNGRNETTLEHALESLRRNGHRVTSKAFDITDQAAVQTAISELESSGYSIDILVNNAGVQQRAPLHEFPEEDWRRILEINLTGAFIVSKYVAQGMIRRGGGKIINICSMQSDLGRSTIAPYAASKGGLKMLTKGMAVDWARYNIQVNGLGPGYFITEMTKPLADDPAFDSWLTRRTPSGRWGDPEEMIGALLLLASQASTYINGQILYVDGGLSAAI